MRLHPVFLMAALFALASCGGSSGGSAGASGPGTTVAATRNYNGTASVGDFLQITVDSTTNTITYQNLSNGDSGTVPYTVNANGTYTLNDPNGNLLAAYEIPSYAMVVQAAKAGPDHNTPALITAMDAGAITLATFEGDNYNYMQFRTAAGGVEVGTVSIGTNGTATNSSYWPFGALTSANGGQSPFHTGTIDLSGAQESANGTYLSVTNNGETDYVFGTANGVFAVDTPNGAIFGLAKAGSKAFDPTFAGNYTAIYYEKMNATTGTGNVESGDPSLGTATMSVDSTGDINITDSQGNTMAQGTLIPIADAAYLFGSAGELTDPCFGVFTVRVTLGGMQQDVFVSFLNQSAIFSSFSAVVPAAAGESYNYFYGVGLLSQ
jgi:hypothetical protein